MFSETSRSVVEAKNYFIFKYVVENTRLKKSYQIYIGKQAFFEDKSCEKGPQFVQKVYGACNSGVYFKKYFWYKNKKWEFPISNF